jgi:ATP-dependent protease ClpP protease subunit
MKYGNKNLSKYSKNTKNMIYSSTNPSSKYQTRRNRTNNTEDNDDDCDNFFSHGNQKQLGYFSRTQQSVCITIPIDEPIYDASYYRQCIQAITNTSEDDVIEYDINSSGGDKSGLVSLLTAMQRTNAETVANINGDCHSAASMLAMHCNSVNISPFASMMVHFVSYGVYGKATDIKSQVIHTHETNEQFFRDTYRLFLTEEEIEKCINGFEIWMDAKEISDRMKLKYDALQVEYDEAQQQSEEKEHTEPEYEQVEIQVEPEVVFPNAALAEKTKSKAKKTVDISYN